MFRRYPYWGWLILSLALWCLNGYYFHMARVQLTPAHMAATVTNDLHKREQAAETFMEDKVVINHVLTNALTETEMERVVKLPFYVYGFSSDSLAYWNTNSFIPDPCDSAVKDWVVLRNDKGVFLEKCMEVPLYGGSKQLILLLPVYISYSINNDYLKSHFVASSKIPATVGVEMSSGTAIGKYAVTTRSGKTPFYLHFHADDYQKWTPNTLFIILLMAALLASISWMHLIIIHLTRNKSSLGGFLITLGIIAGLRILLYIYGLPFNLDTLLFFSPRLYASSKYLSSFGDLCINTLCVLWLIIFVSRHTPYKNYFDNIKNRKIQSLIAGAVAVAIVTYLFLFISVIRSLVLDSNISFDVSHYSSIDTYTVLGLLEVGIITGLSCMIIYLMNTQLKALLPNPWARYVLIMVVGMGYLLLTGRGHDSFSWLMLGWLLLFVVVLDYRNFTLVSDLFEPHMIFWAVFICVYCTSILKYFNDQKENSSRVAYVMQKLSPQRDNEMEYAFDKAATRSDIDILLKSFFKYPSLAGRHMITQRFDTVLSGAVSKYNTSISLYDAEGAPLYNKDTVSLESWQTQKNESLPTSSPNLFYKESILGDHYYLAYMPVYSDSINQPTGYVVISLDRKKQARVAVYPELLQPTTAKSQLTGNAYAYAVYINSKLISQTSDYPFTTYLSTDSLEEGQPRFVTNNNVSELHYKVSDKRTVVVVHEHDGLLGFAALFSYIFVILVLLALVIIFYQVYLSYFTKSSTTGKLFKLTLRKRVHLAMLVLVLASFIIIGTTTIYFFTKQFKTTNEEKLQTALQTAKEAVQEDLKKVNAYDAIYLFDSFSRSVNFKNALSELAKSQKIDINIYDDDGYLFATSQDDIYDKGVLSRMIRPEALYQLSNAGKSKLTLQEHVGNLSYSSAYEPLRNEQGHTLGYINVPFFASERELNSQITGVIVTFINLYAFIFLISSLISVGVTRWITKSFNLIIQQFGRLNLQKNERIVWEYDDEIGLLVNEYNKMVNKVEENAALLAQSERESAWREMARQVAHEIKNPLTPMKLNIQYLQQAMRNDAPNIKELTSRVSETIIEQIDNLSYIASEFSNFAKMPEAKPEELELGELISRAVDLQKNRNEQHIKVTISKPSWKMYVYSDKSQLLRVCNNLLENARHALEECENGRIEVSLTEQTGDAVLAIKDNGQGIPHDVAKKIFQPYFTTKTSGTGLGLAMTRKIIEFWKGEIWFDTEEGKGTTFYIKLPLISHPGEETPVSGQ